MKPMRPTMTLVHAPSNRDYYVGRWLLNSRYGALRQATAAVEMRDALSAAKQRRQSN